MLPFIICTHNIMDFYFILKGISKESRPPLSKMIGHSPWYHHPVSGCHLSAGGPGGEYNGISPGSGHWRLTLEWRNLLSDQLLSVTVSRGSEEPRAGMNISLTRANCMRYNCRVIRAHSWKMQSCFVQAERVLDFQIIPEHHNCSSGSEGSESRMDSTQG